MAFEQHDEPLVVEIERSGGVVVVAISGMLDLRAVDQLRSALETVVSDDVHLVLDLSNVDFLDSSGLRTIIRVREQLVQRGGSMALRGKSERVERILEITGVRGLFTDA